MTPPARPALAAVLDALDGVTGFAAAVETLHTRGLWPDTHDAPNIITSPHASRHGSLADVASLGTETIATVTALVREAIEHAQPKPDLVSVVWRVETFDPRYIDLAVRMVQNPPLVEVLRLGVGLNWSHSRGREGVSIFAAVLVPPIDEGAE